ncbi:MAG: hypothetical protein LBB40_06105 [Holophagales bacterium]|jgi:hypothetical protein|nr:hypothetical protein [Holophagales bacterium]
MTNTHAHPHLSPQRIETLLNALGALGHKKYADVKSNPKQFGSEARERYEYVREGHTVRDCTRRLLEDERQLDYFAKKGKPDPAAYLVQKVIDDTEWDTDPKRSYPTCQGELYRLV